jgi:hypothetical protein
MVWGSSFGAAYLPRFWPLLTVFPDLPASDQIPKLVISGGCCRLDEPQSPLQAPQGLSPGEPRRSLLNKGGGALPQIVGDESAPLRDGLTVERVRQG